MDIKLIVQDLINKKKEDEYWDFKQEFHTLGTNLIHDILSLANNPHHSGDRYIIYGVNDITFEKVLCEKKWNQSDLIDFLNKKPFSDSNIPKVELKEVNFDDKTLFVMIIKDSFRKPYFLSTNITASKKGPSLFGNIYSRVGDRNTPKDRNASCSDIQKMWEQRLRLDQTPLEKFKNYLEKYDNWERSENNTHYKYDPNYKIINIESNNNIPLSYQDEWTRGELGACYTHSNGAWYEDLYYYETCLKRLHLISFDGGKKIIVAPRFKPINHGRFYYYDAKSIEYTYQKYFCSEEYKQDYSKKIRKKHGEFFDIPVIKNDKELNTFLDFCKKENLSFDLEPEKEPQKQTEIFYSLLEYWEKFKKKKKKELKKMVNNA